MKGEARRCRADSYRNKSLSDGFIPLALAAVTRVPLGDDDRVLPLISDGRNCLCVRICDFSGIFVP